MLKSLFNKAWRSATLLKRDSNTGVFLWSCYYRRYKFEVNTTCRSQDISIFRNLQTSVWNADQIGGWLETCKSFFFFSIKNYHLWKLQFHTVCRKWHRKITSCLIDPRLISSHVMMKAQKLQDSIIRISVGIF